MYSLLMQGNFRMREIHHKILTPAEHFTLFGILFLSLCKSCAWLFFLFCWLKCNAWQTLCGKLVCFRWFVGFFSSCISLYDDCLFVCRKICIHVKAHYMGAVCVCVWFYFVKVKASLSPFLTKRMQLLIPLHTYTLEMNWVYFIWICV